MIRAPEEPFEPGKYLGMLVRAYNPNQYAKLLEQRLRTFLAFLAVMVGVTGIIFSIVVLALTVGYVRGLPQTLSPVTELKFSGSVAADAPVILLDRPSIVLDMASNGSETTQGDPDILFTQGGLTYPQYVYAGHSFVAWSEVNDLKRESPLRDRMLGGIIVFLAPSLIFWGLVYHLGRILLLALALLALGYWLPRVFKHRIGGKESLKLLILTLPSALLFSVGLSPLAPRPLFWWGVALTTLLFALGIAMISERSTIEWNERKAKDRR